MNSFDGIVVGSGIVGLASAYQIHLAYPNIRLCLVDKESGPAQHQTGHNSGVLHSGIYYPPGSQKAKNCLRGKVLMETFCQKEGIPFEPCGKVIVAKNSDELYRLNFLFKRAQEHSIPSRMLSKEELKEREPHVAGIQAILVENAGIVNYSEVCRRLLDLLVESGRHQFIPHFKVTQVRQEEHKVHITSDKHEHLEAKWAINAAGLYSDKIASKAQLHENYKIVPFRGEYYKLKDDKKHLCRHLIYPVPDPSFPFLGVHLTRMITGEVECGPNAVLALGREGYTWGQIHFPELFECLAYPGFQKLAKKHFKAGLEEMKRSFFKSYFCKSLQELVPEIQESDLVKAPAGIRAQALEPSGKLMDDFHFVAQKPWLHLCNVPSPAATSSLHIGKVALEKLESEGLIS